MRKFAVPPSQLNLYGAASWTPLIESAVDLLALDGGSSATEWQKKHRRRKAREAKLKAQRQIRAEAKADLKKRTKKWRARWKAKAAANKAAGLPPPTKHGRPRDISKPQWIDMTGQRFGKLTVLRIAPVSKNGKQNCRRWKYRNTAPEGFLRLY